MPPRNLWSEMYRSHTCFKGLNSVFGKLKPGRQVAIENQMVPPCRVCRAWWRQSCHRFGCSVKFRWPGGEWAALGPKTPAGVHNQLRPSPYSIDRGMVVIAEENQDCALWGYRADGPTEDPEIFQSDLGDESYGPWTSTGLSRSAFLTEFGYWNQANGGASISVFGEQSDRTARLLNSLAIVIERPDYRLHEIDSVMIAASPCGDIYVWGADEHAVRTLIPRLSLEWNDIEA
jgi:hypothetical protein